MTTINNDLPTILTERELFNAFMFPYHDGRYDDAEAYFSVHHGEGDRDLVQCLSDQILVGATASDQPLEYLRQQCQYISSYLGQIQKCVQDAEQHCEFGSIITRMTARKQRVRVPAISR